jgi:glycosyltransferase involved in cell wall biosynthesis
MLKQAKDISTVIVTHYNTEKSLMDRCIRSIEKFGIPYIIVDDGSDNPDLNYNAEKIIYLPENKGTYYAFNEALKHVKTEYTTRMDSDDYFHNDVIIDTDYEVNINTIRGKRIQLDVKSFLSNLFAGLNGISVKTDILKKEWYYNTKQYGDIIIFARLLKYKCRYYDICNYTYTKDSKNRISNTKNKINLINKSKEIIRKEHNLIKESKKHNKKIN